MACNILVQRVVHAPVIFDAPNNFHHNPPRNTFDTETQVWEQRQDNVAITDGDTDFIGIEPLHDQLRGMLPIDYLCSWTSTTEYDTAESVRTCVNPTSIFDHSTTIREPVSNRETISRTTDLTETRVEQDINTIMMLTP